MAERLRRAHAPPRVRVQAAPRAKPHPPMLAPTLTCPASLASPCAACLQGMLAPTLKEYGFAAEDLMSVATQLMGFGGADPTIAADTSKLMKAAQGDLSDFV